MKYIKHFSNLSEQTAYLAEADIDTYLGYVDENDTVYYDDTIPERYDNKYFTIESLEDGNTIYLKASDSAAAKTVSASTDNGETWVEYVSSVDDNGTALGTLNTGDKLLIKGENARYAPSYSSWNQFKSTGQFEVYGNIMSLVSGDSFANADTLTEDYALYALFYACPNITSAENLVLPAATLTESCYSAMFQGCTSLTTAPELPATTLAYGCYNSMFSRCSSLNYIKCLANDISARECTYNWVYNVPEGGTFVKNAAMTGWTTGTSGIPSGWTVVDA